MEERMTQQERHNHRKAKFRQQTLIPTMTVYVIDTQVPVEQ